MKTAFIIHASYSNPDSYWYPSLKQALEVQGYEVFIPHFPTPEHQSLSDWKTVFAPYESKINSETLFIGHSIGCAFILRQLEKQSTSGKIAGCVLVAPFIEKVEHDGLNLVGATFISQPNQPFDWHAIHQNMGKVHVLGSDDDSFVSTKHIQHTAELAGVSATIVSKMGHFEDVSVSELVLKEIEQIVTPAASPEQQAFSNLNEEFEHAGIDMTIGSTAPKPGAADNVYSLKENKDGIETMYEDIADTINTSSARAMADMLHEEREKETARKKKKRKSSTNVALALLALLLVGIGFFFIRQGRTFEPETIVIDDGRTVIPTPFRVNESILFDMSSYRSVFQARDGLANLVSQHAVPNKTLLHIYPGIRTAGIGRLASLQVFFRTFEVAANSTLIQSVSSDFTYGIYGSNAGEDMFLLVPITSVDGVFVGMQEWEETIVDDLEYVLGIPDNVKQPSLYEQDFEDELLLNTPMRILRAPTVTKRVTTETIEERIDEPTTHALPAETLLAISDINETGIVFAEPDPFLADLSVGNIITAGANTFGDPFIRRINDFVLTEETFIVATETIAVSDITPDIPAGGQLVIRTDENGDVVKYIQYEQEVTSYVEGSEVPVLYHAFLGSDYLVITTGLEVIEAIIERLGESEQ